MSQVRSKTPSSSDLTSGKDGRRKNSRISPMGDDKTGSPVQTPARPRAQSISCSRLTAFMAGSPRPPTRASQRRASQKLPMTTSPRLTVPTRSLSHRISNTSGSGKRLSPATVEAARLALAARAEYSKRRSSKSLEKAAFFIVTKEGEEPCRLDDLELAVLLHKSSKEKSSRPSTPAAGSGKSIPTGLDDQNDTDARSTTSITPVGTPATPVSIASRSPKRKSGGSSGSGHTRSSSRRNKRISSMSSDASNDQQLLHMETETLAPRNGERRRSQFSHRIGSVEIEEQSPFERELNGTGNGASPGAPNEATNEESELILKQALTSKPASFVSLAIVGVIMLSGTCAFLLSYALGRGESWSLIGSSVMGVGCLFLLFGVCWYLANTTRERTRNLEGNNVEIRMIDSDQLARIIRKGTCVKTFTVQAV